MDAESKAPKVSENNSATESKIPEAIEKQDNTESKVTNGNVGESNGVTVKNGDESQNTQFDEVLYKKIRTQIEYYFGDYNLPRDKFFREEIKKEDGWVPLTIMIQCKRLAQLSKDAKVIVAALKNDQTFMEVNDDGDKIRRSTKNPLPDISEGSEEETTKRTIYLKGFPKDGSVNLDILQEFFKPFGEYDAIKMRTYTDRGNKDLVGFKGSILVVFKTAEIAEAFIDGPATMYQKTYLIKKWFADYQAEKKAEYEERKAKKNAKSQEAEAKESELVEIPKGAFLKATGFAENTTREDIAAAVQDLTGDLQFTEFRKGDEVAYLRFSGKNTEILAALKDDLKVNEASITVTLVEGEEEAEQMTKAAEARKRSMAAGGRGKKRKGGFGGRGGHSKRGRR